MKQKATLQLLKYESVKLKCLFLNDKMRGFKNEILKGTL